MDTDLLLEIDYLFLDISALEDDYMNSVEYVWVKEVCITEVSVCNGKYAESENTIIP